MAEARIDILTLQKCSSSLQEEPEGDSDGAAVGQSVDYQTFLDLYKD